MSRVNCNLLPACLAPLKDLAMPSQVTRTAAARLRKRKEREGERANPILVGFPWNDATRAASAGRAGRFAGAGRAVAANDIPCPVCNAPCGRSCSCGARFARDTQTRALSSFVDFVRRSSTPVYEEDSPEDQWRLVSTMHEVFACEDQPGVTGNSLEALVRFVSVASFSGRPDTIDSLKAALVPSATNADFLQALALHIREKPFWRGGQAHGGLSTAELHGAYHELLATHARTLASDLRAWNDATTTDDCRDALRRTHATLVSCSKTFKAADYFTKRALEICVLAGTRKIAGFKRTATDLDLLCDRWPIATGTKAGLCIIWPTSMRNQKNQRQALRVLQRALGGMYRSGPGGEGEEERARLVTGVRDWGRAYVTGVRAGGIPLLVKVFKRSAPAPLGGGSRRVPLVRISAFLCFWQRAMKQTLPWPVVPVT